MNDWKTQHTQLHTLALRSITELHLANDNRHVSGLEALRITERRWSEVFGFLRPENARKHLEVISDEEFGMRLRARFMRIVFNIVRGLDAAIGPPDSDGEVVEVEEVEVGED